MAEKDKSLTERLLNGEEVRCTECERGIYKPFTKNIKSCHDFICNNCNNHIHFIPNIIID